MFDVVLSPIIKITIFAPLIGIFLLMADSPTSLVKGEAASARSILIHPPLPINPLSM
jgi:hypothetical protein